MPKSKIEIARLDYPHPDTGRRGFLVLGLFKDEVQREGPGTLLEIGYFKSGGPSSISDLGGRARRHCLVVRVFDEWDGIERVFAGFGIDGKAGRPFFPFTTRLIWRPIDRDSIRDHAWLTFPTKDHQ